MIGSYEYMAAIDLTDAFYFYTYTFYLSKILKIYIHFITYFNYFMHVQ